MNLGPGLLFLRMVSYIEQYLKITVHAFCFLYFCTKLYISVLLLIFSHFFRTLSWQGTNHRIDVMVVFSFSWSSNSNAWINRQAVCLQLLLSCFRMQKLYAQSSFHRFVCCHDTHDIAWLLMNFTDCYAVLPMILILSSN